MSELKTVQYECEGGVGVIRLNRPQVLNAFDWQQVADLQRATEMAEADGEARVVLVTGAGRGFSAGADLSGGDGRQVEGLPPARDTEDALMRGYFPSIARLVHMPKTVICAVNGPAAGAGAGLALAGDLCIMAEKAYIMLAFSNIALIPDCGATWLLARSIGYRRAYQAAIEATKISAQECLAMGIANKVVSPEAFDSDAMAWARLHAERAPEATRFTKEVMRHAMTETLEDNFRREATRQNGLIGKPDNREGIDAFMHKRRPVFKGA